MTPETLLLCTFAVLILLSVRDWKLNAYSCPGCGTRTGDHSDDCHFRSDDD